MKLNENERIDDLEFKNLKIIQNKNWFCFGIDSVLLSDFAKEIKNNSQVLDLGTGTGIISILLSKKIQAKKIYGIEIQKEVAEMAKRSILLNNLEKEIEIINKDIKELDEIFDNNSIDAIVTNPPYKKEKSGEKSENLVKLISRHEETASLEEWIQISFKLLKDKGELYMVHRPERLVDIISLLRKNKLEPKTLQMVYSNVQKEPKLVLIKAVKNAKSFLQVKKPLIIYDEEGNYTDEILKIYNKK